jgi:Flp pilus assembly protein TadD
MMRTLNFFVLFLLLTGCASQASKSHAMLTAPAGTNPAVATQLDRGNALFSSRDYAGAEQAFRQTIAADSTLAEAHYNLAVTLDRQGNQAEAKKHYVEAANLAPGHKIIWNAPPFQTHSQGLDHDIGKRTYQDPTYKGY